MDFTRTIILAGNLAVPFIAGARLDCFRADRTRAAVQAVKAICRPVAWNFLRKAAKKRTINRKRAARRVR
jgi:hypothetical protein